MFLEFFKYLFQILRPRIVKKKNDQIIKKNCWVEIYRNEIHLQSDEKPKAVVYIKRTYRGSIIKPVFKCGSSFPHVYAAKAVVNRKRSNRFRAHAKLIDGLARSNIESINSITVLTHSNTTLTTVDYIDAMSIRVAKRSKKK